MQAKQLAIFAIGVAAAALLAVEPAVLANRQADRPHACKLLYKACLVGR